MSTPPKLRGSHDGIVRPITKFKGMWRTQLSEEAKREFLSWFAEAGVTNAAIRARIRERWDIALDHDSQLSGDGALRDWCQQELKNDAEAEAADQDEKDCHALGLKGEALRTELLERMKRRALKQGDHKLGLAAVDRDLKAAALAFDAERFKASLRTKMETALAAFAEHIKGNAAAQAAYEQFQAVIIETTK